MFKINKNTIGNTVLATLISASLIWIISCFKDIINKHMNFTNDYILYVIQLLTLMLCFYLYGCYIKKKSLNFTKESVIIKPTESKPIETYIQFYFLLIKGTIKGTFHIAEDVHQNPIKKNIYDWYVKLPMSAELHTIGHSINQGKVAEQIITLCMLLQFKNPIIISDDFNIKNETYEVKIDNRHLINGKVVAVWLKILLKNNEYGADRKDINIVLSK